MAVESAIAHKKERARRKSALPGEPDVTMTLVVCSPAVARYAAVDPHARALWKADEAHSRHVKKQRQGVQIIPLASGQEWLTPRALFGLGYFCYLENVGSQALSLRQSFGAKIFRRPLDTQRRGA